MRHLCLCSSRPTFSFLHLLAYLFLPSPFSSLFSCLFPLHSSSFSCLFLIRMGLLDKLKARPRRSAGATELQTPPRSAPGRDYTRKLPRPVLAYIFVLVCPHCVDESYETSEESMTDGCMLCDMRDLAHSAQVCKRWAIEARTFLYASIPGKLGRVTDRSL